MTWQLIRADHSPGRRCLSINHAQTMAEQDITEHLSVSASSWFHCHYHWKTQDQSICHETTERVIDLKVYSWIHDGRLWSASSENADAAECSTQTIYMSTFTSCLVSLTLRLYCLVSECKCATKVELQGVKIRSDLDPCPPPPLCALTMFCEARREERVMHSDWPAPGRGWHRNCCVMLSSIVSADRDRVDSSPDHHLISSEESNLYTLLK